jgi:cysteine desulfurase / selenocysteine lyase
MDWMALRQEFPVTQNWAFFDHAAVAPLTARARQTMADWAADLTDNGDVHHGAWMRRVENVRALFAKLLDADPLDIAFVKNTSEGIGIIAEGYPWEAGDNVVTAAEEYPANLYPWLNLGRRGVEFRRIPSRGARIAMDDLRAAMDARTRIVSLSWVEFASGFRNDLDTIGSLCRERGILFFVDAIQGLGVFPLNLRHAPVDFLAADGHKWLLGPEGAGILYVRRELVERLQPIGVGWNSVVGANDFSRIDFTLKSHAGRWESGTLNVAGILGLGASLELLLEIGTAAIAGRILELTDYLCRRLAERPGAAVFSSRQAGEGSGIVSIALASPAELKTRVAQCKDNHIVVNQRAGRLRVSPHCYNTFEEIDRLVALLHGVKP